MNFSNRRPAWLNQALRQAPWRTQAQATSLLMALVIVVAVIGAMYLAQASRTAAAGRRLQELEAQRLILEQQNDQLRAEVASLRSVPRLIAQAEAVGYHAATTQDLEYMPMQGAAPSISVTPTPSTTTPELAPAYEETLGDWLTRRMAAFTGQISGIFNATFGPESP